MLDSGRRILRHVAICSAALCTAASTAMALPAGVVAMVGDEPVTRSQYDHWYRIAARSTGTRAPDPPRFEKCVADKLDTLPERTGTTRKQLRRQCAAEHFALRDQVMQLLLSFLWIRGEAERQGIGVTQAEVNSQFREQKRASFGNRKEYERFLRESGQTKRDILMRVELDLVSNAIRERVTAAANPPTERAIRDYYRRNSERFTSPERRNLLVLLTETKSEASAARARIEAGESWAKVARKVSTDRRTRSRGGKLPGVARGSIERKLGRAVFAADRGQISGPVRTRGGWWVFEVTRIRPARREPYKRARSTILQLLESVSEQRAVDRFVQGFNRRWRAQTVCRSGYVTVDCANAQPSGR